MTIPVRRICPGDDIFEDDGERKKSTKLEVGKVESLMRHMRSYVEQSKSEFVMQTLIFKDFGIHDVVCFHVVRFR